jgi:hypothetical protein
MPIAKKVNPMPMTESFNLQNVINVEIKERYKINF